MSRNKTLGEALREGKMRLKAAGKDAYAFEAELLMEKAAGLSRTALFLRGGEPLEEEAAVAFADFLRQREEGRPVQYILGQWEFMGLPFFVGEGVLIPRGDTEGLIEAMLEKEKAEHLKVLLDIGTGSGCIPVSLGHYGSFETLLAVDISPAALAYAKKNAAANGVSVEFFESDLFSAVPSRWKGRLDGVVSNPPYIPRRDVEELMAEVRDFEPRNDLDGGEDGLDFYRRILRESREWLREDGWIFFEIGYDQGEALLTLLKEYGYAEGTLRQDLAGLDRVVFGRKCRNEVQDNV